MTYSTFKKNGLLKLFFIFLVLLIDALLETDLTVASFEKCQQNLQKFGETISKSSICIDDGRSMTCPVIN